MATSTSPGTSGTTGTVVENGVKITGEALLAPGTSLILDGEIARGGAHVVGGLLAKAFLGPIGWILVATNSYLKSTTGKHIHEHLKK